MQKIYAQCGSPGSRVQTSSGTVFWSQIAALTSCSSSLTTNGGTYTGDVFINIPNGTTLIIDVDDLIIYGNLDITNNGSNCIVQIPPGNNLTVVGSMGNASNNNVVYQVGEGAVLVVTGTLTGRNNNQVSGAVNGSGTISAGVFDFGGEINCGAAGCPTLSVTTCNEPGTACASNNGGSGTCASSTGGVVTPNQSTCGTSIDPSLITNSGYSGVILRWESSIDGGNTWTGLSPITPTYDPPVVTTSTLFRTVSLNSSPIPCNSYSVPASISVGTAGTPATPSGPSSVCSNSSGISYFVAGVVGAQTYEWSYSGTGVTITGNTNSVTLSFASGATSGNLRVRAVNGCGNGNWSPNRSITVGSASVPSVNQPANQTVCNGSATAAVTFTGTNATTYTWTNNNTSIGLSSGATGNISVFNAVNIGPNPTVSQITVTPSNATCSGSPKTFTYTVNPSASGIAAVSISAIPGNAICSGSSVTFTPTPINGGIAPTYSWRLNGAVVASGPDYTNANLANGNTVSCTMTSNACVSTLTANSNTITMTVTPSVTPTITVSQSNTFCDGPVFSASIGNGGASPSYQWQRNNIIVGSNSSSFSPVNLTDGDIITCVLSSSATCATPASVSASVTAGASNITWNGSLSNVWNVAGNWSSGTIPGKNNSVSIPGGLSRYPVISANAEVYNFTIAAGGSVTLNNGILLNIYGNYTQNGTMPSNGGIIQLISCGGTSGRVHTLSSDNGTTLTFSNLTLNDAAGAILSSNASITDILTLSNGTLTNQSSRFAFLSTVSKTAAIAPITGGSFIGNITMQRIAPGGVTGWSWLGSPVTNATLDDWYNNNTEIFMSGFPGASTSFGAGSNWVSVYTYNESSNAYVAPTAISNALVNGRGYWVYLGNEATTTQNILFDVSGSPKTGNTNFSVTYTPSGGNGFNLIANPYPSAINWASSAWTKTNISNYIYTFNADINNYAIYGYNPSTQTSDSTNGGTRFIPSSQGFMVKANGSPVLIATESVKAPNAQPSFLRSAGGFKTDEIRVSVSKTGSAIADECLLKFNEDQEMSLPKIIPPGESENVNVYFIHGHKKVSLMNMSKIDAEFSLPIKVDASKAGVYSLHISNVKQAFDGLHSSDIYEELVLEDVATKEMIPFHGQPIDVTISRDGECKQFVLRTRLLADGLSDSRVFDVLDVQFSDGKFFANAELQEEVSVCADVYNTLGQVVKHADKIRVQKGNLLFDTVDLKEGCYVFVLLAGSHRYTSMFVK